MLTVLAGCLYVWDVFRQDLAQAPEPALAIPEDALAYVRLHPNWASLPAACQSVADIIDVELPQIAGVLRDLDSLRSTQPQLQELLSDAPFGWSIHRDEQGQTHWLLSVGIKPSRTAQVQSAFSALTQEPIWTHDGLVLASSSADLLDKAKAKATAQERPLTALDKAIAQAGAPAVTLFYRSTSAAPWDQVEIIPSRGQTTLAGLIEGDMPPAEPYGVAPLHVFPASTSALEWYSSSTPNYLQAQEDKLADINRVLADLDQQCNCNYLETHFSPEPGFGLLMADQPVLVMHTGDAAFATQLFEQFANLEEAYAGRGLHTLRFPYQASLLFTQPDLNLNTAWTEGEWLFLTTSTSNAKNTIRALTSGRTFDLQVNAVTTHRSHETPALLSWTRNPSDRFLPWPMTANSSGGEMLNVSTTVDNKLYSSISLKHGASAAHEEETGLAIVWEQSLDDAPFGRPWTIKNHYTGAREVLIQSEAGRLTLYSAAGQKLWSATVDGSVLGDVQQVDLFDNGKLQLAFSTTNSIYLLDRNGNLVEGFPVRLPSAASSPLAIFDYDNSHDYRFVIATDDGQLLNYSPDGTATRGWKAGGFDSAIAEVRHLRIRTKDYVFAREIGGPVHLLKRDGTVRYNTEAGTPGHGLGHTAILSSEDIASCRMLYADTGANVIEMAFNESYTSDELVGIMQGQWPTVVDFGGDHSEDIVIVDGPNVKAYNAQLERIFRYEASGDVGFAPQVFRFSAKDQKIGLVVPEHDEIWLLNDQGIAVSGFPAQGSSPFAIADLDLNGSFELITFAPGNLLRVYALR